MQSALSAFEELGFPRTEFRVHLHILRLFDYNCKKQFLYLHMNGMNIRFFKKRTTIDTTGHKKKNQEKRAKKQNKDRT